MERAPAVPLPTPAGAASPREAGPLDGTGPAAPSRVPHGLVHTERRVYARIPLWAWVAIVGLCLAAVLPVLQTSGQTEAGVRLLELEAQRERLRSEVRGRAAQAGELASLARIEESARTRLGMIEAFPTASIEVQSAAPPRELPSRYAPIVEPVPEGRSESPLLRLLELLIFD